MHSRFRFCGSAAALLLVLTPCLPVQASKPGGKEGHHHETIPGVQSLDVYATTSQLHLLTGGLSNDGSRTELYHQSSSDAGKTWSAPVRVDAGQPAPHAAHRGMDPQIAASGDQLMAVWMTPGTDMFGGGPMATALSSDGGKTWKAGPNPADDGSTTGHGFLDVAADARGSFHLTWLDTRGEKRGLRYARSEDGGTTWSRNDTVDAETCECCWNVLAAGPDGRVGILYRNKEPRDMSISWSSAAGTWSAPVSVGGFNWEFQGCPHVGGGLAAGGEQTSPIWHAVVWTGMEDSLGVHHVSSPDAGATWSKTQRVAGKGASHPDIAARGQEVIMVWDTTNEKGSHIEAARSSDGGKSWQTAVRLSSAGPSATHPRVVASADGGFRVFWTQRQGEGPTTWQSSPFPSSAVSTVSSNSNTR
ncbi:BNR repeat protein [Roseimicrobium gellanilyticum]|uniref:BNR repeat protein n=1 Tax=Roseimicrobium gellanilyticum TaxID=748857 RepID=A0A366HQI2_9BACT|nr:sialidase family protein [Roseimicrobium gellanilyticum]RBP45911.1 BNR repeat protein [Roseimicrobium gellanilyticum]